ncbi:helix-turn-helix domain-containing protein [Umezawaea sp. Da 62-37]|uniref:helix-turn-helix domain-containing protein n=1 Tax=Umezawaea sp. Da 62-37 TaxID=3075927 RepID=UPI0028F7282F|nr:helix-turn-helix domain-containing protein [Umezawaea sp. Da 62-37]WNV86946.1 helix-turn-helix domain-containing protein [Umezawaea sp. Da 62-37]
MALRRTALARARKAVGLTQEALAEAARVERSTVVRWEAGTSEPLPFQRPKLARLLKIGLTELDALLSPVRATGIQPWPAPAGSDDDEQDALELARRVNASDVGRETLERLEAVVDELAIAYPGTPPVDLLERVRRHLRYVNRLLDARKTLGEHRRLLVVGGWLSLLGATVHIDLDQPEAAIARLRTAASLATHTEHAEIHAWTFETEAWRVLTEGDHVRALELSHRAMALAPTGSSVEIQATAQSGRAHARLGQVKETHAALNEVQRLASPLQRPDKPEHHYRYDPDKAVAYTATTLAWIGDPAAEGFAREIIRRLNAGDDPTGWPRRVASANIDMSLALLVTDRLDEACHHTMRAMTSGRVVPSNHWRAAEVVRAVELRELPEAAGLREVYEDMRRR